MFRITLLIRLHLQPTEGKSMCMQLRVYINWTGEKNNQHSCTRKRPDVELFCFYPKRLYLYCTECESVQFLTWRLCQCTSSGVKVDSNLHVLIYKGQWRDHPLMLLLVLWRWWCLGLWEPEWSQPHAGSWELLHQQLVCALSHDDVLLQPLDVLLHLMYCSRFSTCSNVHILSWAYVWIFLGRSEKREVSVKWGKDTLISSSFLIFNCWNQPHMALNIYHQLKEEKGG